MLIGRVRTADGRDASGRFSGVGRLRQLAAQAIRERGDVAQREIILAGKADLAVRDDIARQDGQAVAERFEQGDGHPLVTRGEDEEPCVREKLGERRTGLKARHHHTGNASGGCLDLPHIVVRVVGRADDHELDIGPP